MELTLAETLERLSIALGLGLLMGMQRQSVDKLIGLRTFPIVAICGMLCGILSESYGAWCLAAGAVAVAGLLVMTQFLEERQTGDEAGSTTEFALLLIFLLGAYLVRGHREIAIVIGGGVTVLLHFKKQLHGIVDRFGEKDLLAIMQLALVSMVILPILPDKNFGPFDVLNPRNIWLMVVFIVAMNLAGYVMYKLWGEKAGTILMGILGGMISSTATTLSFSRKAKTEPRSVPAASLVIMIASTIVFIRIIVEIGVVAPSFLPQMAMPILVLLGILACLCFFAWIWQKQDKSTMPLQENPSQLKGALVFAALYAFVLLAIATAKHFFGTSGLYIISFLSGLTDIDAITLSTSRMVGTNSLDPKQGWRLIMIAALANLIFKTGIVAGSGNRDLLKRIGILFGIAIIGGIAIIFLWPAE
jgi:uncharacterized membrane protein (DUF4010 family)